MHTRADVKSELAQLKLGIETSVGDSTPTEAEKRKFAPLRGHKLALLTVVYHI